MPFNYFTSQIKIFHLDTMVSKEGTEKLDSLKTKWTFVSGNTLDIPQAYNEHQYWFSDSLHYINEYNELISQLYTQDSTYIINYTDTLTLSKDSIQSAYLDNLKILFADKYFPEIDFISWDHILKNSEGWPDSTEIVDAIIFDRHDTTYHKPEMLVIKEALKAQYVGYNGKTNLKRTSRKFNDFMEQTSTDLRQKLNDAKRQFNL